MKKAFYLATTRDGAILSRDPQKIFATRQIKTAGRDLEIRKFKKFWHAARVAQAHFEEITFGQTDINFVMPIDRYLSAYDVAVGRDIGQYVPNLYGKPINLKKFAQRYGDKKIKEAI